MAGRPVRLIVTGASGFVGRHLLDAIKDDYVIYGIARRSQARAGAPVHPNIAWFQTDIGEREQLQRTFGRIRELGGADAIIHLAAHYDFTGEDHPEYWRTNVDGLRNVLDFGKDLGIAHFVFSSSVAACNFPRPGGAVDEDSPPDANPIYSKTKAIGEAMLRGYDASFKTTIVRFAALFSDWCEYPPLFMLLETWLSRLWNARMLAGRGRSAIPYLHVREIPVFMQKVLDRAASLRSSEILVASPDAALSHARLFEAATESFTGRPASPIRVPKAVCAASVIARDLFGRATGKRPFERRWMLAYIDRALAVDAARTRSLLGWAPRERLELFRRMPFLVENFKADPLEWHRRNRAALDRMRVGVNLRVHALLERHEGEIARELTAYMHGPEGREQLPHYQPLDEAREHWHHHLVLRQIMNAVRTRERGVFLVYCDDLGRRRFEQGFEAQEVCHALESVARVAREVLARDRESEGLEEALDQYVGMTVRFGCDRILDVYESLYDVARRASVI